MWLVCSASSFTLAWEGHDWDEWRLATGAMKPEIESPQAGVAELLPLMVSEGEDSPRIDSIRGWETKRDRILGVLQKLMGEPTNLASTPAPEAERLGESDQGTYTRVHLRIRTEPDDWIPAYLLIPKKPLGAPSPTMIVLHQTVAQGKDEPAGIKGDPELDLAHELAQRGFICLVPDAIGFGERIPPGAEPYATAREFYKRHPRWSFFGKMAWDTQRIVDYLVTLPEVDPYRIGIIGHSHGGYGSIIGAAFEPRISAVVVSCGFTSLRHDDRPDRWSHLTALLPILGFYLDDIKSAPIDWHEIIATIAPRPMYLWIPTDDKVFPHTMELWNPLMKLSTAIYNLYGQAHAVERRFARAGHAFTRTERMLAYDWLSINLPVRDTANWRNTSKVEWETKRELVERRIELDLVSTSLTDHLTNFGSLLSSQKTLAIEELSSRPRDGYTERLIAYTGYPFFQRTSAYLFLPDDSYGTSPAVVVFHQTTDAGKEEPAGHAGRTSLHFGPELARRGYIVLIPDSICAGERIMKSGPFDTRTFYEWRGSSSAMGHMVIDARRAIDVLQSLPEVDPDRIGVMGHSLGAEIALFVAAFDERVKAAVASCGFAPFAAEKNLERWARDHWFSYMPRLRIDLRAGRLPAWDFDDVIRLVAPRGYFNFQATDDEIFPEGEAIHPLILDSKPLWAMYGAEENLVSITRPGPHDVPDDIKAQMYAWLDRMLLASETAPN